MLLESRFQKLVIDELRAQGAYVVNVIVASNAGVPDLLVCYNNKFIAIEIKASTGRVTKLQYRHIEKIKNAGGQAFVLKYNKDWKIELRKMIGKTNGDD